MCDGLQEETTGGAIFWIIVYKHTGKTVKTEETSQQSFSNYHINNFFLIFNFKFNFAVIG